MRSVVTFQDPVALDRKIRSFVRKGITENKYLQQSDILDKSHICSCCIRKSGAEGYMNTLVAG